MKDSSSGSNLSDLSFKSVSKPTGPMCKEKLKNQGKDISKKTRFSIYETDDDDEDILESDFELPETIKKMDSDSISCESTFTSFEPLLTSRYAMKKFWSDDELDCDGKKSETREDTAAFDEVKYQIVPKYAKNLKEDSADSSGSIEIPFWDLDPVYDPIDYLEPITGIIDENKSGTVNKSFSIVPHESAGALKIEDLSSIVSLYLFFNN